MYAYFVLVVSFLGVYSDDAAYMDPSHLPVLNLNAAARGYDIYMGEPFSQSLIDPGIRAQIFKMTKTDKEGRVALHPGVESDKSLSCKVNNEGTVITSVKQYRKQQKTSLIIGEGWQIGRELKVSIGADIEVANINLETKIDPFLRHDSTDKTTTENMDSFFTTEKGAIVQLEATCVKHWIRVSEYVIPKFRKSFVEGLKRLYKAAPKEREHEFKTFLSAFGTHYSQTTAMGSRMVYSRRYTNTEKQFLNKDEIVDCAKKHSKILWGTYDRNRNDCKTDMGGSRNIDSKYMYQEQLSSVGSKPFRDLEKWTEQEMKEPVPIKMQLRPIIALFTSRNLAKLSINATQMVQWYLPMYFNSCSIMNYQCNRGRRICGVWDDCEYGETCIENGTNYHCRKSNVTLYWRRHRDAEDTDPDRVHVLTMSGEPVMGMEKPRCSTRYCNWTIEQDVLTKNHIFTVEPKCPFSAWTTEFGRDKWIPNHNYNRDVDFRRIHGAKGYWINIKDKSTGDILVRYMKQCKVDPAMIWNEIECKTRFHANTNTAYDITIAAARRRNKEFFLQTLSYGPETYYSGKCDGKNPDEDCDNVPFLFKYEIGTLEV